AVRPEDLGLPVGLLVRFLLDALDLLHERREVGELGPQVVGGAQGQTDVLVLADDGDLELLLAARATASADRVADLLLERGEPAAQRPAGGGAVSVSVAVSVALASEDRAQSLLGVLGRQRDRKSTRLNSSHVKISYAVFCLKQKMR